MCHKHWSCQEWSSSNVLACQEWSSSTVLAHGQAHFLIWKQPNIPHVRGVQSKKYDCLVYMGVILLVGICGYTLQSASFHELHTYDLNCSLYFSFSTIMDIFWNKFKCGKHCFVDTFVIILKCMICTTIAYQNNYQ